MTLPRFPRHLLLTLLVALLATAPALATTPAFTITGISDEAVMENMGYTSATPVTEGSVSGTVTYSLLYQLDPFNVGDLSMFAGMNLLQILAIFLTDDTYLFSVDSTTGEVSLPPMDYETPLDVNHDNVYSVTLVATDSAGNRNTLTWNVTILNQPAAVFSLGGISNATVNEGKNYASGAPNISGQSIGTITYSLFGNDASLFSVNNLTGAVSLAAQDYENPLDSNADNIYEVTLVGTDSDLNSASLSWTVTILNLPPLTFVVAPIQVSQDENQTYLSPMPAIFGSFRSPLHYSLSGDDASQFTLNPNGSVILSAQDFELPVDANADNVYEATLTAIDNDNNTTSSTIAITILDIDETGPGSDDRDGDGAPNTIELVEGTDPDNAASFKDSDHDGTPDVIDDDADNDNLLNIDDNLGYAPYTDHDLDTVPDYLDADDRGDGSAASCIDIDSNQICDPYVPLDPHFDRDQDGTPNHADIDSDNDFVPDILEGNQDHDGDTLPDFIDKDSDGDGIPDIVETMNRWLDGNHNGIADCFDVTVTGGSDANLDGIDDNIPLPDSDLDGQPDPVDKDSDNDGIPDALEGSLSNDSDGDTIDDYYDYNLMGGLDDNNDGVSDLISPRDTDGDGTPDFRDSDSDNDGIPDSSEAGSNNSDSNSNGIDDQFDAAIHAGTDSNLDGILEDRLPDSDGDGAYNHRDLDSDNDALPDIGESGGTDSDSNGLNDTTTLVTLPLPDADADGTPDYLDSDSDGNGIADITGTVYAAFDTNLDGRVDLTGDHDNDGIDNSIDTAPYQFGLLAADSDFDGIFDNLDNDDDNDSISDSQEGRIDSDNDGIFDLYDRDSDQDGISDYVEAGVPSRIGDSNLNGVDDSVDASYTGGADANLDGIDDRFAPRDSDGDGIADYLDTDSDNDGVSDREESSGLALSGSDADGDGIDDLFDVDFTHGSDLNGDGVDDDIVMLADIDGDGLPNHLDGDSDNDGFADGIENDDTNHDGIPDRLQPEGKIKSSSGGGSTSLSLLALLSALLVRTPLRRYAAIFGMVLLSAVPLTGLASELVCREYTMLPSSETDFVPCFYGGIGLGISSLKPDTDDSSWEVSNDRDSGFGLYAGYQFSRSWFAELAYTDFGKASLKSKHLLLNAEESISYSATSIHGGYYLPLQQWLDAKIPVNIFMKAGMARLANTASDKLVRLDQESFTLLTLGAGIEWPFHDNWMLRGEVDTYSAEATFMSLAVGYWFGGKERRSREIAPPAVIAPAGNAPPAAAEATPLPQVVAPEAPAEEAPAKAADSDSDGIKDPSDDCPGTPAGTEVDARGCSIYKGYVRSIYGAFNSTDLTYPSYDALDTLILMLNTYPDTRIRVIAHTDSRGSSEVNLRLSRQRAAVVKDYLVKNGIRATRIETRGMGSSQPIADNSTEEGRSKNRRIDFEILNK